MTEMKNNDYIVSDYIQTRQMFPIKARFIKVIASAAMCLIQRLNRLV